MHSPTGSECWEAAGALAAQDRITMCSALFASSGTLGEPEIEHDGTVAPRRLAVVRVCLTGSAGSVEAGLGILDVRAQLPCNSTLVTTRTTIAFVPNL